MGITPRHIINKYSTMLENETNPMGTDTSMDAVNEAVQEGGSQDVERSGELSLEELGGITGRSYASTDEALKHLKDLNSFVGDQEISNTRKMASEYQLVLERYANQQGMSPNEAKTSLLESFQDTIDTSSDQDYTEDSTALKEIKALKQEIAREKFLGKNPGTETHIKAIEAGAKGSGETLEEFYESSGLKDLISTAQKSKEENTSNKTLNATSRANRNNSAKLNQLADKVRGSNAESDKQDLVAEWLTTMKM